MCLVRQLLSDHCLSPVPDEDLNSASKDDAQKERFGEGDEYLTVNRYH